MLLPSLGLLPCTGTKSWNHTLVQTHEYPEIWALKLGHFLIWSFISNYHWHNQRPPVPWGLALGWRSSWSETKERTLLMGGIGSRRRNLYLEQKNSFKPIQNDITNRYECMIQIFNSLISMQRHATNVNKPNQICYVAKSSEKGPLEYHQYQLWLEFQLL